VAVEKRTVSPPVEVHGSQVSEVVAKITWTAAAGGGVKPGEFQEFPVSMGPLPDVQKMVFKTLQTYSDGNISRWIEEPAEGAAEPEQPAPVLTLTAASTASTPPSAATGSGSSDSDSDSGTLPITLAIVGLVAGLGGLVLGGLAFARTRRTET
jgi:hypothetical protein